MHKQYEKIITTIRWTGIAIAVVLMAYLYFTSANMEDITIGQNKYEVEVVESEADQIKGLGDRDNLESIDGMLFVYSDSQMRNFWMKDMRFDLDIVWINENKVVGITENISHADQQTHYPSPTNCDAVLELAAGQAKQNNIQIGDEVQY